MILCDVFGRKGDHAGVLAVHHRQRDVLSWLGGGAVIVAGGIWTVVRFFVQREQPKPASVLQPEPPKSVSAVGGVAAGGNISGSPITITNAAKPGDGSGA